MLWGQPRQQGVFIWPRVCIIDAHYHGHCQLQTLHRGSRCQVNVSLTSSGTQSQNASVEPGVYLCDEWAWPASFTWAYHQLRRFCFIKSTPWCADTGYVGDKRLSLIVFFRKRWIRFSAFPFCLGCWQECSHGLFHRLIFPSRLTVWNFGLGFTFCMLPGTSVAFPQRAGLILCYWLTRSCFAPSHKPSL